MSLEKFDLTPWNIIIYTIEMCLPDGPKIEEMVSMFIEKDGESFYIFDESNKVSDVSKMPPYIKEDWIKSNRREITLEVLDKEIKELEEIGLNFNNDIISRLKAIRREIQIKKIIN